MGECEEEVNTTILDPCKRSNETLKKNPFDVVDFNDEEDNDDLGGEDNEEVKLARKKRRIARKQYKAKLRSLEEGRGQKEDYISVFGPDCLCSVNIIDNPTLNLPKENLKMRDIHMLILWILTKSVNQQWAFVKNSPMLEKVVTIVVDGLSENAYEKHKHLLPILSTLTMENTTKNPYPLHVPCSIFNSVTVLNHFMNCLIEKIAGIERPKKKKKSEQVEKINIYNQDSFVATTAALREQGFPLEKVGICENYYQTIEVDPKELELELAEYEKENITETETIPETNVEAVTTETSTTEPIELSGSSNSNPISNPITEDVETQLPPRELVNYDLWRSTDCEFVDTARGKVLARLSILNGHGKTLVDEIVIPQYPVTDYLTRFSGITEELVSKATVTFEQARQLFLKHVKSHHYLVGHSLENDLHILEIIHPKILDSTILFPHPKGHGFKQSLKYLAQNHLDLIIQNDANSGHDSVLDAQVALDLVKKKIRYGPSYGQVNLNNEYFLTILGKLEQKVKFFAQPHIARRYDLPLTDSIVTSSDHDSLLRATKILLSHKKSIEKAKLKAQKEKAQAQGITKENQENDNNKDQKNNVCGDKSSDNSDDSSSEDSGDEYVSLRPSVTNANGYNDQDTKMLFLYLNEANHWFDYEHIPKPLFGDVDVDGSTETSAESTAEYIQPHLNDFLPSHTPYHTNYNLYKDHLKPLTSTSEISNVPPTEYRNSEKIFSNLNTMLTNMIEASPRNTMFVVLSGQASIRKARHYHTNIARLKIFNEYYPTDENRAAIVEQEALFRNELETNQKGVVFIGVTK